MADYTTPWRLPGGGLGLGGLLRDAQAKDAEEEGSLAVRQPSQEAIERGRARRKADAIREERELAAALRDPWD